MAITKIHPVKTTVQKSVDYICNPHKTDNRILVESFACGIETAEKDFEMENRLGKPSANPAYHLIQSFAPGEVTFEEAHAIGQEFAARLLQSTRPYVLATHVDKDHVHNHLIFCSSDIVTHERYNDCNRTYRNIRKISDELCSEHHLSVITPGEKKGMAYNEWEADRKNNSIKLILKRDIFDCIRVAWDYEDFLRRMAEKGYQIKGFELGEGAPKYISFKPAGYGNFIRGSYRSLGKGNTKEEIIERINRQIASREEWKEKQKNLPLSEKKLLQIAPERLENNPRLEGWVERQNLKIAAATYASVKSYGDLVDEIKRIKEKIHDNRSLMVSIDKEKKLLTEQLHYLQVYTENKPAEDAYHSAKDPDKYLQRNESRLILFAGAKTMLERMGVNPEETSVEELQKRISDLEKTRAEAAKENKELQPQLKELAAKEETLRSFLHIQEKEKKEEEKSTEKRRKKNKGQEI